MESEIRKWIFIRGLGRHALHWAPFTQEFKKQFPEDQIEFLELRGNGTLAHSSSFTSISENVRDLRSRSQFLKSKEPVYLMTLSLGSMIGTEWAHRYPSEIAGLVTMNTSDKGTSAFYDRMRPLNYLKILKAFQGPLSNDDLEAQILKKIGEPDLQKELLTQFSTIPTTSKVNFLKQLLAAGTYEFPEHKPKTEVLLLCSEGDELCHFECTRRIAEMWGLKAHIHPTARHDLPLEAPEWICQEIRNWLNS